MRTRLSPGSAFFVDLIIQPCSATSLGGESQLIEVDGVGRLHVISVHLIVNGDAIPPSSRFRTESPVEVVRNSVQRDRLVQQFVGRGPLSMDGQVVPGIIVRIARNAGGNPMLVNVVPDIPLVAASNSTLLTPDESQSIKELIEIELDRL